MSLPQPPNATCDIYRAGTAPPAAPAAAGVRCVLHPDWRGGRAAGNYATAYTLTWTHVLLLDATADLRDGYTGALGYTEQDSVYVPDKTGTRFKVIFVERVGAGTAGEYKRAFLDRQLPPWPTNAL